MEKKCIDATKKQIQMEIKASIVYMSFAAHFSKDVVNRPGFAKFFFGAASEEREHATKLIDYLSMRGTEDFDSIVNVTVSLSLFDPIYSFSNNPIFFPENLSR